ncbi:MAG TPA: glycoside hydrolase family 5 protein [Ktedonobacteraceae bacterium]|nr:glycoside hydrolase family 5 protein [Ktedonobacteraceae bacterium]
MSQPPQSQGPSPREEHLYHQFDWAHIPPYDHPTLPDPPPLQQFLLPMPGMSQLQPDQQQSFTSNEPDPPSRDKGNRRSAWQWYRSTTPTLKTSIGCGMLLLALVLCLFSQIIIGGGNLPFHFPSPPNGAVIDLTPHSTGKLVANQTPGKSSTPAALSGLPHVMGNQIVDGSGHPLILHGTHIQSQFNTGPWGNAAKITKALNPTIFNEIHSWHMNALRIPVSAYMYMLPNYMNLLDAVVQQANQAGLYVILANFEDAQAGGGNSVLDQQGLAFWKFAAAHYKDNPMLMFDLINEPHYPDWGTWLNGNSNSVGLQPVVNAIRATGAQQIIIAEWNEDGAAGFSTIGANVINDSNIVYSMHTYLAALYHSLERAPQGWDIVFGNFASTHPMYIGEWAFLPNARYPVFCQAITPTQATQLVNTFLDYMQQKGINWTAWSFTPSHLILDTTSFTPTTLTAPWCCGQGPVCPAGMGSIIKSYLSSLP